MRRQRREPDPVGLDRARSVARYQIGDASWADMIIEAHLNPPADDEPAEQ